MIHKKVALKYTLLLQHISLPESALNDDLLLILLNNSRSNYNIVRTQLRKFQIYGKFEKQP